MFRAFLKSAFLLRPLEEWLTSRLLASRSFHKLVGGIHRKVHHLKTGVPLEDVHGPDSGKSASKLSQFFEYFREELKDQMKGNPRNKH
ncbi:hypothetical protein BO83DRAFT_425554 [Aspergillus eucalypticola CBS 122712]|uniref:Uncharacterized protein n=1 Tax=Aspergillus eucalypticola (strain CBS 122712 / IBT 29274) TaxID=1448314 RepID=A0A317VUC7_ASPEC|nr:uncharacterized protein BO83DRAFT_425554 [Aspergillus eucalypticola CBS 122712]PWY76627.1 hypothetical protein BO83DRAFT_425554 [Aspergillus eucalypticola CBS 122712]